MSRRTERVAEAIRRITGELVQGGLRDPRLEGLITVTKVEVAPNLRYAKIFYSFLGEDKKKPRVAKGLKSAKNYIRKHIAEELKLRYAPDIVFETDSSMEYAKRIDTILNKLHDEEKDESDRQDNRGA
ncbi:MAG: 30S ribosome-binding factor RbfA [Candidatus Omnitrophota bacterium]